MTICETKTIDSTKKWTILAVLVNLYRFESFVFSWNMNEGSLIALEIVIPTEEFLELEKSGPKSARNFLRSELITQKEVFNHVAQELSSCGEKFFEGEDLEEMGFETDFFVLDYRTCDHQSDVPFAFDD